MTKLQEIRKKKELSQFELAKYSNISIQAVHKYEQGKVKIESCRLENLLSMAEVLGISFVDLFDDPNFKRRVEEQLVGASVQHAER